MLPAIQSLSSSRLDGVETNHPRRGATLRLRLRRLYFHLKFADRMLKNRARALARILEVKRHLVREGTYVDVGGGAGHFAECLVMEHLGRGGRCIAVDPVWKPTRPVARRLRRRRQGRVLFLHAAGERLPLADACSDGLFLLFVLHHVPYERQLAILREARRVLKRGGLLFLIEDTPQDEQQRQVVERWDRRVNFEPKNETHYYRPADQWRELLMRHDFTIINESPFSDDSRDGPVPHTSFVAQTEPASP